MRRQKLSASAALFVSLISPAVAIAASGSSAAPGLSGRTERTAFIAVAERRASEMRRAYHRRLLEIAHTTRLARRRDRLAGHRPRTVRHYHARMSGWSTAQIHAHARALRHRIRVLRRTGGAPNVAIPPQLKSIAACESGGNPRAVSANGAYRGLFQFDYGTWASVGGHGDPAAAPAQEQYRRAAMLYARSGSSPWPVCGR